ncbi:hypothetical protein SISNIDRAFT_489894 [Sistotremastrum niveocremeum HHB9708]|uniref:Arrestin-like N-terminal domain-containing protein n=1 Tax=Sistotremastrum niveocremeum HHB9708 TaxID=1314777 RepID=A0A164PEL9_9AGAM|nr:hypothetical protein SISNIDRAFT_489894 [Sistotremastrum niveocremeum HHB9708]
MKKIGLGRSYLMTSERGEEQDGISLEYDRRLKKPGSIVRGVVKVNDQTVRQKGIEEVTIELIGRVKAAVVISSRDGDTVYKEQHVFLQRKLTLWRVSDLPPKENNSIRTLPFAFDLPLDDPNMPPSYSCQAGKSAGSVGYFVKIIARKSAWYKFKLQIYAPFPFRPFDLNPPPALDLARTRYYKKETQMRKGIMFGAQAKVTGFMKLPKATSLTPFQDIPVLIHIHCYSKPLPSSCSSDPSSFNFPLPPTTPDALNLTLQCRITLHAKGKKQSHANDIRAVGGFGDSVWNAGVALPKVERTIGQPRWTTDSPDDEKKPAKEGRWFQEVMFKSSFNLNNCPPSIDTGLLVTQYVLQLKVTFGGIRNVFMMHVDIGNVSSGIYSSDDGSSERGLASRWDLPPFYWEVIDADDDFESDKK